MTDFTAVTDETLERARHEPAFRRKLLSDNLEILLAKLNKLRAANRSLDKTAARQIRDGVDLAVRLAEMLQQAQRDQPSKAA
jgi:hypothetical protein